MYNSDILDSLKINLRDQLDNDQYGVATTRTQTGYRRIRGPAGSGKSLALAARAAMLASEGKRVLVCNFNITLHNYLSDLVGRFLPQGASGKISFQHFHRWCRSVCENTESMDAYNQLWENNKDGHYTKKEIWDVEMPKLVSDIYESPNTSNLPTYDAILVDEGQDYLIFWWQTLRKAVVQGGEMLLVADKTQNIHETAQAWTEVAMSGCGFVGPWRELQKSYRLPARIIPILEDFCKRFPYDVGDGGMNIPPLPPPQSNQLDKFRWVQVSYGAAVSDVCIKEVERLYNNPAIPTVYFLSGTNIGIEVVEEFQKRGADVLDTHSKNWQQSRKKKVNLYPGYAEICATTLQSFKGWEASHIVIHVEKIESFRDRAIFYTALSRLNKHPNGAVLTVVSSCSELEVFGRKHFDTDAEHDYQDDIPF